MKHREVCSRTSWRGDCKENRRQGSCSNQLTAHLSIFSFSLHLMLVTSPNQRQTFFQMLR
ncbi:unnamed protein product [Gulo gulo]|uniref:Uncharacterized protein n=1 Tax=Gulo gulo TaxID=48420 RepID=A0A9X9M6F2_GULGU|nr:unnamed protein product [Gulo gulo]